MEAYAGYDKGIWSELERHWNALKIVKLQKYLLALGTNYYPF